MTLTAAGAALRKRAEEVPAQIVQRLKVPVADLEELRDRLTLVLRAAERAGVAGPVEATPLPA